MNFYAYFVPKTQCERVGLVEKRRLEVVSGNGTNGPTPSIEITRIQRRL